MSIEHTLKQAELGEFAPLREEAATTTPEAFSEKHGSTVRPWGRPRNADGSGPYKAVMVGGTDYLWRTSDGLYDGWDRNCEADRG